MAVKTVFHRPRGGGKTYAIAQMAKRDGGVIITKNADIADHIRQCYGLAADQVMSYHQLQNRGTRGWRPRKIYIDDADWILRDLLRLDHIDALTISNGDEYEIGMIGVEQI